MAAMERKRKNNKHYETERLNTYVWSAPAVGCRVHNDKGYHLSSPTILDNDDNNNYNNNNEICIKGEPLVYTRARRAVQEKKKKS